MAQYLVPKFIEKEPTIIGPLTFRQFIYIGIAGLISGILFFTLESVWITIIISVILFGVAISLAFFTLGGKTLPSVLWDSVKFFASPKVYLWKKKRSSPKIIKPKEEETKEEKKKGIPLKVVGRSRLKETETRVKTWKK